MSLIQRLEALTGPDREVDLELWWACKARNSSGLPMDPDYKAQNLKMNDAPRYTFSIDAALTLFPETDYENEDSAHRIELTRNENVIVSPLYTGPVIMGAITRARFSDLTDNAVLLAQYPLTLCRGGNTIKNRQHAIAIAFCIAALKARGVK